MTLLIFLIVFCFIYPFEHHTYQSPQYESIIFLGCCIASFTTLVESKALYLYETVYVTVAFKDGQEYTVYDDFNKESVPTAIETEANFETPIVVPETQEEQHEPLEPTIPNQDPDPIPELVPEPVEEPISVPEYIEEPEPQYEPEHEAVPVEEPVPAPIQLRSLFQLLLQNHKRKKKPLLSQNRS